MEDKKGIPPGTWFEAEFPFYIMRMYSVLPVHLRADWNDS